MKIHYNVTGKGRKSSRRYQWLNLAINYLRQPSSLGRLRIDRDGTLPARTTGTSPIRVLYGFMPASEEYDEADD